VGGPPKGAGGPPGTAAGPGNTAAPAWLETAFEVAFKLFYLGDETVIDSSKNLRVLWTRALLANLGKVDDPVAFDLLPPKSRWVVGQFMADAVWKDSEAVKKLDWIVDRTKFIDGQLTDFLKETVDAPKRQVIVLGSGYDTRAIRFAQKGLKFFEVDLPEVSSTKSALVQKYLDANGNGGDDGDTVAHIKYDLNDLAKTDNSLLRTLKDAGLEDGGDIPTCVICEAVLFYLNPAAVQNLVGELFGFAPAARFVFTDNLSKVGVTPGPPMPVSAKEKCEAWLSKYDKQLVAHDSIWGGAIHFVGAAAADEKSA